MIGAIGKFVAGAAALRFVPAALRTACFLGLGVMGGAGLFVVHASRALSYLSDEPETCVNCHVMNTQYLTWQHGSHARAATCNDCHVPHDSFWSHYAFKAEDGLWHATVFTMRWEPQVIRLSQRAVPVVENNCRRCHEQTIGGVALAEHGVATSAAGSAIARRRTAWCGACRPCPACFRRVWRRWARRTSVRGSAAECRGARGGSEGVTG